MSHPVFLNASVLPRMPNGTAGEWRAFWDDGREELEAYNGIPLLWFALFGNGDLQRARLIDDADLGTEDRDEQREANENEETIYPYLVTSREQGLQRLEQRKAHILAAIGQEHAPVYDAFTLLIERYFGPFILLRTSGLPDAADAEPWLLRVVAEMDGLDADAAPGPELKGMADEVRRVPRPDAFWVLSGSGAADVWPTPELVPVSARKRSDREEATPEPTAQPSVSTAKPRRNRNRFIDSTVEWLAAIIVGGSSLAAYFWASSFLAGLAAFIVSSLIMGWGINRLRR